jgi:hypothetical protein
MRSKEKLVCTNTPRSSETANKIVGSGPGLAIEDFANCIRMKLGLTASRVEVRD